MLKHLLVENYVLIEHLSVEFSDGFNAITGETGAGKSILLGALNLILGTRADSQSLLDTSKKCVVEGLFIDAPKEVSRILEENSLDVDSELILRREIAPGGKSRAFINDTPVTLTLLKTVGDMLVDIHSQHNTLFLNEGLFQLLVIDHFAGNEPIKIDFASLWNEYKALRSQLEALILEESAQIKERDYIEFQYNELVSANVNEGEQENELELANAAADIAQRFSLVTEVLNSDDGVITKLKSVYQTIRPIAGLSTEFEELGSRINSVVIELQDLASTVEHAQEASSFEPDRIELLREKLDQLYRLEHKH
nr:AAA family ATPase [Bacteroidales bacterium]